MKPKFPIRLLMSIAVLLSNGCTKKEPMQIDPHENAMAGQTMSVNEASDLESKVVKHANDLPARTKLLGYYFTKRFNSAEAKASQRKHALWIIKNRPEADIAGLPYCGIDAILDREGYNEGKQLWLEQTKAHAKNAEILGHAAQFLLIHDKSISEDLLKQAQSAQPDNPQWSKKLGLLYSREPGKESAVKALTQFEKAQKEGSEMDKFYGLDELAKSAFKAGEIEKASQYANELLQAAQKYPNDWNYGNAIHHGNNVLGAIALKEGNSKQACEYLLKAGATPGSPQLNSFGPNMSLAKELLEKGERDIVLQYFELCRKFWEMGGDRLDKWTKELNEGKTPQFGASLRY